MNVVDTSGWLAFFADEPNAAFFEEPITAEDELIVPTICIYEVFKRLLRDKGERYALQTVMAMEQGNVTDLHTETAIDAAKISTVLKLPMADSIILATARAHGATVWTQDVDFEGIEGVRYIPKGGQTA